MSEENQRSVTRFVDFGVGHHTGELGSDGEENLRSQLIEWNMTSTEVDSSTSAIVFLSLHN